MLFGGYFPLVATVFFTIAAAGMTVMVRQATGPAILAALAVGYALQIPGTWRHPAAQGDAGMTGGAPVGDRHHARRGQEQRRPVRAPADQRDTS
jgi:hypothetical protein